MKINILGKEWIIIYENESNNKILRKSEAYCDYSTRKIVINDEIGIDGNLETMDYYKNKVIRHELIHAFFFESGLTQYFYDETAKQNRTHIMWPWLKKVKSEFPIAFDFDEMKAEVIGNLYEGIKKKGV